MNTTMRERLIETHLPDCYGIEIYQFTAPDGRRILVRVSPDDTGGSLPTWLYRIPPDREWRSVRGSAFDDVDEEGVLYQEPRLVAEFALAQKGGG